MKERMNERTNELVHDDVVNVMRIRLANEFLVWGKFEWKVFSQLISWDFIAA